MTISKEDRDFIEAVVQKDEPQYREARREQLEEYVRLLNFALDVAQELIPEGFWDQVPDEDLAQVLGEVTATEHLSPTQLRESARSLLNDLGVEESTDETQRMVPVLHLALRISLTQEFGVRYLDREKPEGRAVREFLNQRDDDSRNLLVEMATKGLVWHPDCPAQGEVRDELGSMANEGLWTRIQQLPAWNHEFAEPLRAMLRGGYERIPGNVRKSIKDRLTRRKGQAAREVSLNAEPEDNRFVERLLAQAEIAEAPSQEPDLLVAEILKNSTLSAEDRELIEMRREGVTQEEIAKRLGKTQSAVSQQLRKIREKLSS